ncbi:Tri18 [Stachybotrys chartarum IBT 7711]|uniref:Tri18 n=1 Tax=Stachybotrys chartarum (strain CBS 109288 / IBT 7711) TaxID=1280523 RepID=A0A084AFG2_STACB|nr:Tri18 [Stachybotrys chartarum IBT 7711]
MGSSGQQTADSTRPVPPDASSPKAEQYAFPLPTLDPAEFRWHPYPKNNSILQRKANGVEALVGIKDANAVGTYDLYNNIVLRVGDIPDLTLPRLKRAFVRALLDARFENPSIACYGVWGQNKEPHLPHIQYRPFKSHNEARAWAYNSIYVRATSLTSSELRAERIEKRRAEAVPQPSNSLDIVISADVAHERTILEPGTKVDLMFLFNHLSWDGKARSFTSELVHRATQILEKGLENTVPAYRWGEEKARLDPPILDVMLVGMETLGDDYKAVHRKLLESQMQVGLSWGLPVTNHPGDPLQLRYCMSVEEGKRIANAVKSRLGLKYNIGHLGHAATVLAMLKHHPIPASAEDTAFLFSPLPVDGRGYLSEDRTTQRYGNAQASAVVEFQKLASWGIKKDDPQGLKTALDKLAKKIRDDYNFWLGQADCLLPISVANHNFASNLIATSSATPKVHAPAFCNDGRSENIISHEVLGLTGKKLFEVEDCFMGVEVIGYNAFIRMDTWKDAIRLTLCYNNGCFSDALAKEYTKDVAKYMLAYADA